MDAIGIDRDSGVPLYRQVADDMRRRIDAGELSGRLPSELGIAAGYGVVKATVRKALALLREWGYVETFPGKASRVRAPGERGG